MSNDKQFIDFKKEVEKLKEIDGAEEYAKQLAHLFLGNGLSLQTILLMAIDFGQQHPQWIPVEEVLPAFGQEVLVYAVTRNEESKLNFKAIFYSWRAFSTRLTASDRTDVCDFMLYFLGSRMDFRGFHVTHWMPIVPPRKEDKK